MKVTTNTPLTAEAMDPEARAAVMGLKDAQKMKQEGRKTRRQAQRDQITHMKRSAEKLRDMADMKLAKGIVSGVVAATSFVAAVSGAGKGVMDKIDRGVKILDKADPFGIATGYMEADKAEIDAGATAAGQHADNAGDDVKEGARQQESMTRLMEKVLDARHAARTAALKG
jgi:hypothetical protein